MTIKKSKKLRFKGMQAQDIRGMVSEYTWLVSHLRATDAPVQKIASAEKILDMARHAGSQRGMRGL